MGVTESLRILLTLFLSTACMQNLRLFGVYDVRWPFLAEIYTAPLKRFVPSSVLQAVRALRNAPAALRYVHTVSVSESVSVSASVSVSVAPFTLNQNSCQFST